jgi:hypothetical protein
MFATMTPIAPLNLGLRPRVSAAPCGVIVVNPLGVAASDWNSPIHHPVRGLFAAEPKCHDLGPTVVLDHVRPLSEETLKMVRAGMTDVLQLARATSTWS